MKAAIADRLSEHRIEVYAAGLALVATGVAIALVGAGFQLGTTWAVVALALLSALGEEGRVRVGPNMELSISLLPTLFAAVTFGPLAAMIVAAASMIGEVRRDRGKWFVYTLSESITGAMTGLAASAIANVTGAGLGGIALAAVGGALTSQCLDIGFAASAARLRGISRALGVFRTYGPVTLASVPLYTPVVALLAFAYREVSPWTLPLFLVPTLAAQRLFALYQEQRELAEGLSGAIARLESANLSFASALVATLDARDRYTAGHSAAVAVYSRDIAARLGLSEEQQQRVHLCGLVHDIGKIGLPAGLLEKAGALSLEERRQMEEHTVIGERILSKVDDYSDIAAVVRHHHERIDGFGYPDGIGGDEMPLLAKIISVADAYDAMTSDRPYREAMPSRVARLRLAQAVETQFDTTVVAAFEAILAGASENYRSGNRRDFDFNLQEGLVTVKEVAV